MKPTHPLMDPDCEDVSKKDKYREDKSTYR